VRKFSDKEKVEVIFVHGNKLKAEISEKKNHNNSCLRKCTVGFQLQVQN
jgi:hypothetical protein